jgi:hypothetical protein
MSPDPDAQAAVIVREGTGLVGLKDAHTAQAAGGAIRWRMAVLLPGEAALLDADPSLAKLPSVPAS